MIQLRQLYKLIHACALDEDLINVRRRKARNHYANMPPDKKAELNAKRRENYHRRKAEKQAAGSFHVAK